MRVVLVRLVLALAALGLVGMHALGSGPAAAAPVGAAASHGTAAATVGHGTSHDGTPPQGGTDDGAPSHHGSSAVECVLLAGSAAAGLAVVVAGLLGLGRPARCGAPLARLLALARTAGHSRWWLVPSGPPVPATACVLRT